MIGSQKGALKVEPMAHLERFGVAVPPDSALIQHHMSLEYLVRVVDPGSKSVNFDELRAHQFQLFKSASHLNLLPISQCLTAHIFCAFFNAYTMMYVLDSQLQITTSDVDPPDYRFISENANLLPVQSWSHIEVLYANVVKVLLSCVAAVLQL